MSRFSRLVDRKTAATTLTAVLLALAFCVSAQAQSVQIPWAGSYVQTKPREQTDLGECGYRAFHICRDRCPPNERAQGQYPPCMRECGRKYLCNHPDR